jgi:hypothetical protein
VLGRAGIAVDFPERIPLHQADSERRQPGIQQAVMTVLYALDRKAEFLKIS